MMTPDFMALSFVADLLESAQARAPREKKPAWRGRRARSEETVRGDGKMPWTGLLLPRFACGGYKSRPDSYGDLWPRRIRRMFEAPILVSPFTTKSFSFSFLCVAVHSCSIAVGEKSHFLALIRQGPGMSPDPGAHIPLAPMPPSVALNVNGETRIGALNMRRAPR